ncbi:MAG: hypothetical protein LBS67_01480 [Clostridiales Family XIII bacterium]|jgi:hypothetical protein|nr:hypothetical protein [Clostridiales Family XIII bacterium]
MQKKVFVVLTRSSTTLSRLIHNVTRDEYTHAALALDENFEYMFSFGRRRASNPFIGCFKRESFNDEMYGGCAELPGVILEIPVTNEQYGAICGMIESFLLNGHTYRYNAFGLVGNLIRLPREIFAKAMVRAHRFSRRFSYDITELFAEERRQIGGEGARHRSNRRFPEETSIGDMSLDSPMDLAHIAGEKRRDTGGITRLFAEERRQIGGEGARHRSNRRFPHDNTRFFCSEFVYYVLNESEVCDLGMERGEVRPQTLLKIDGRVTFSGDLTRFRERDRAYVAELDVLRGLRIPLSEIFPDS